MAEAKRKENDRMKEAFGISKDYVGGSAFDRFVVNNFTILEYLVGILLVYCCIILCIF